MCARQAIVHVTSRRFAHPRLSQPSPICNHLGVPSPLTPLYPPCLSSGYLRYPPCVARRSHPGRGAVGSVNFWREASRKPQWAPSVQKWLLVSKWAPNLPRHLSSGTYRRSSVGNYPCSASRILLYAMTISSP